MLVGEQEGLNVLLVGIDESVLQYIPQVEDLLRCIPQPIQELVVDDLVTVALRLRDGAPSRSGGGRARR